ncbi:peptidoglycan DD-metalloendopeptidase family protein [Spongorhabdus nitratireducens]
MIRNDRNKSFFSIRRILLSVTVAVAGAGMAFWYSSEPASTPVNENDERYSVVLLEPNADIPETDYFELPPVEHIEAPEIDPLQAEIENLSPAEPEWHEYVIASGDTLGKIFRKQNLSVKTMYSMLKADGAKKYIKKLRPGQKVRYQLNDENQLQVMEVALNSTETLHFELNDDKFRLDILKEAVHYKPVKLAGEIKGSFYLSAARAGLTPAMIQQFANIFEWQLDFSRDLRAGDRFEILHEQARLSDGKIRNGNILVARLYRGKKELTGIRYEDGRYYSPEGKGMGRALMRYPVDKKYRISSSFNRKRRHPVTGRVRPHYGTDWATPTGTRVRAPGDGVVVRAVRRHPAAGNFIEIRHGRNYVTRYLHLSRINVRKGQQIKQGQVIGRTGNTGLSTGPHLHYELHVNGRPVNAMRAKLPASHGIPKSKLKKFKEMSGNMLAQLNSTVDQTIVASSSGKPAKASDNVL